MNSNSDADGVSDAADGDQDSDADDGEGDSDADSDTDADTDSDSDGDDNADSDTDASGEPGPLDSLFPENGEFPGDGECRVHSDCTAGFCRSSWTAPPDPDATCEEAVEPGKIRLLGNVRDFTTDEILPGVEIKIAGIPQTLIDPQTAKAVAELTSDSGGLFDETVRVAATEQPIGLVVHTSKNGYHLTLTDLVETVQGDMSYPSGARNHDVWCVPNEFMDKVTDILIADGLEVSTPFGTNGGALGRVRDADTGKGPREPVVIRSVNSDSKAVVRYINDDLTGFSEQLSRHGIFVVLNMGLFEHFEAYRDETLVSLRACAFSNLRGAAYTASIEIDADDQ